MHAITVGISKGPLLGGIEGAKGWETASNDHFCTVVRFSWSFARACEHIGALLNHDDVDAIASFSFSDEKAAREFGLVARSVITVYRGADTAELVRRLKVVAEEMYGAAISAEDVFLMGASHNLEQEFRDA